jgi:hypothetical protein
MPEITGVRYTTAVRTVERLSPAPLCDKLVPVLEAKFRRPDLPAQIVKQSKPLMP